MADPIVSDRYRLERELGRGGMATVWLARDLLHQRAVAIKILHPELAGAIGVDRFVREMRITSELHHPNIVSIVDSGVLRGPDGTSLPWYAMPYLEGESLRDRLSREGQLPIDEALTIAAEVGDALQAAHRRGIVHRDMKPENVLLVDGRAHVVDFGIAKALVETGGDRLTSTGIAIGTPAYMSPEQAMAQRVDARTDQYALATVLYEMLAGEPPFQGATAQAITARRLTERARSIRPLRSTVTESVEAAILKALERSPADRFPDIGAFLAALRGAATVSTGSSERGRPIVRATMIVAGLLIAAAVVRVVLATRQPGGRPAPDSAMTALYQRGLRAYDRRTPAGIVEAAAAFSTAIGRDSGYTAAWTGLAKSYLRAYQRGFTIPGLTRDSLLRAAVSAADRALATDSTNADVWVTRGMVARFVDPTDVGPTVRAARRAVALDSTSAVAWHTLAVALADEGDFREAVATWRRCVRARPAYTECLAFLSLAHYWQRRYDSAAVWADSAIAVDPSYFLARQVAGNVAIERGDFIAAAAAFDAARRLVTGVEVANSLAGSALVEARAGRPGTARPLLRQAESLVTGSQPLLIHTTVYFAQAHAALGEPDHAFALLTRLEPRRDRHFQLHLRCDPPFDPIRSDPRFRSLLVQPSGGSC